LPQPGAGERLVAAPPPPAVLTRPSAAEWRLLAAELVARGTLTSGDLRALQLLAETLAMESALRETLQREGVTVRGADGVTKSHPALRGLESARNAAHRMLNDFGLTPRAREGVGVAPPTKTNRFAAHAQEVREFFAEHRR
jgi:P27 family predicted phage terminase small subunit